MKLSQKMRVLYMQDGVMLGILQQSDGYLYVGNASGEWTQTVELSDLVETRKIVEVPQKTPFMRSLINKVIPLRLAQTE